MKGHLKRQISTAFASAWQTHKSRSGILSKALRFPPSISFVQIKNEPELRSSSDQYHYGKKTSGWLQHRASKPFQSLPSSSLFNKVILGVQTLSSASCIQVAFHHAMASANHQAIMSRIKRVHVRHKSRKKRQDSDYDDTDSDADDMLEEDDFEAPAQFKVQTIHAPSLRIDAVLSNSLGLSRHRLEEIFFGPGILLNGNKVLKKGAKMDVGDYVDAIVEKVGDGQVKVKRVKLLNIGSDKTSTDKFVIRVRVWKSPFLIEHPDQWKPGS